MDYKRVIEDFNNGILDRDNVTLVMDSDGGYWSCNYPDKNDEENEAMAEAYTKKYGSPKGYRDIVAVLIASGVPSEWC